MNVSSCWSASRHMKSSFSLRRLGVMSLFSSPRVRVCSGGSCVVMCSLIGTCAAVLLDQLRDVVAAGTERQPRERARDRNARRERRVLVDRQCLLISGDGQHIERGCLCHRAFRPQMIEVRIRVGNEGLVGEEVDGSKSVTKHSCFLWRADAKSRFLRFGCFCVCSRETTPLRVEENRQRRRRAEHLPRMCGSSPSGSSRRLGSRSSRRLIAVRISSRARCMPRQTCTPWPQPMCTLACRKMSNAVRVGIACPPAGWPHPSIGITDEPCGNRHPAELGVTAWPHA